MSTLNTNVAVVGSTTLTLGEFLANLHRRQLLRNLLVESAVEKSLMDRARQAGLEVSNDMLQQAVNRFRHQNGLHDAEQTRHWLAAQRLELPDLETTLEAGLLIDLLRQRLTEFKVDEYFAAHQQDFVRARLRILAVASEGEARELHSQLTDEGRDFAELARRHSLHLPSRAAGGSLPLLCRCELPDNMAQALFAAVPGTVVGPVSSETGFVLYLVEELLRAELNEATITLIRKRLFDAYVAERLAEVQVDLSWLDQ